MLIGSGSHAYDNILNEKSNTESARVAYSYINMKIKQTTRPVAFMLPIQLMGNALRIDMEDSIYCTYIFYSNDGLYECLTLQEMAPSVEAANLITRINGFDIGRMVRYCTFRCECKSGEKNKVTEAW